jgi:hypothetical protein
LETFDLSCEPVAVLEYDNVIRPLSMNGRRATEKGKEDEGE